MTDAITKHWIRNEGDERAAANGCRFDPLRGAWTVYWIERFCKLYEGEGYAGNPLVLHGCKDCDHRKLCAVRGWDDPSTPPPAEVLRRAEAFSECVAAGHSIDWQYETFMRLFGWVRHSDKWGREIRRFRQASVWIPKKQGKSPTLAALGMYLLAGDGEPGQKVFLAAKDGEQARTNAGKHAVEMWLQSDELRTECSLNRNVLQITHEPSRSLMRPLSSSNSRTKESKEGLNGSILIDETHVVDRDFVDRISRAGISRSEPLMAEFSTAGNNPDGYGKERFDYSQDVIAGKVEDEELLAVVYASPQDVTDEQLDKDFSRYANAANPSIGRLIDPQEIRRDYERSKPKLENLLNFKMYRLNIWQHSSNPWLRPSDWAKCAANYTEADLLGKPCFAGLDLSLRWDMTALFLLFPWGEEDPQRFRSWVYFFVPEIGARQLDNKVSIRSWENGRHVQITDGDTTDFPLIREKIRWVRDNFDLMGLAYDERFAETLMQQAQDEDGIPVHPFKQTPAEFAEPLGLFEGDVIAARLEHPNNPCLNWQAGNATKGRNGLLMKPEFDDQKKIDGITAGVMARAEAITAHQVWFYNTHPLEIG